jgi:hypothetical protein
LLLPLVAGAGFKVGDLGFVVAAAASAEGATIGMADVACAGKTISPKAF